MITYDDIYNLKLDDFIPNKRDIKALDTWEFMNGIWQGESVGFTTWLKLKGKKKERSISLDLNDLPDAVIDKMLSTLELKVKKGMTKDNVIELLGQPKAIKSFVQDRASLEYLVGTMEKYYLSLTITDSEGLIYMVLTNHSRSIKALEQRAN